MKNEYLTPSIMAALSRFVETAQANPLGGLVLLVLAGFAVAAIWAAKH